MGVLGEVHLSPFPPTTSGFRLAPSLIPPLSSFSRCLHVYEEVTHKGRGENREEEGDHRFATKGDSTRPHKSLSAECIKAKEGGKKDAPSSFFAALFFSFFSGKQGVESVVGRPAAAAVSALPGENRTRGNWDVFPASISLPPSLRPTYYTLPEHTHTSPKG